MNPMKTKVYVEMTSYLYIKIMYGIGCSIHTDTSYEYMDTPLWRASKSKLQVSYKKTNTKQNKIEYRYGDIMKKL